MTKSFNFQFDIPAGQAAGVYVSRVGVHVVNDGGQGVTDGEGALVTLRVKGPPVAAFSFAPASPLVGQSVQFTDSSSDPDNAIVSWNWTFGDGGTSSQQNPSHAFSAPGTYTVTLMVADGDGLTGSASKQIQVTAVPPSASFTFSPASPVEGGSVQFTDTSAAGTYPIASWSWDFGEGATSSQQNPTHAYSDNGAYTVRLTVVDSGGLSASATLQVTVANVAPTADAGPDRSCNVGETLSLSASYSDPGSADTHTFSWDFGDGGTATGQDVSHAYAAPGQYTVTLTVQDDDAGVGTDAAAVTVTAVAPTASFSFSPASPVEGGSVQFTDTSTAGTYPIVSWSWDFGDSATSSQQNPTHAYSDNGAYTVRLTVVDSGGLSASATLQVTVANVAPTADAGPDRSCNVGETLSLSASYSDPGSADTHTFSWDFGDGGTATGQDVSHAYAAPGQYTVTLTVQDDDGGVGTDIAEVTVTQGTTQPTASFTFQPAVPIEGDSVQFTDSSSAGSFPIVSWSWAFGDGSTSQQRSPLHAYAENGNYTVELSITDSNGASSSSSLPLVVNNAAPVVDAGPDRVVRVGELVSFSLSIRDAGAWDSHTVVWDFGDGHQAKGRSVRHGFSSAGAYTVTATASDDDGGVGEDSLVVRVIQVSGGGGSGGEAAQGIPGVDVLVEYNGASFVQAESAAPLSCLVSPADGMDAAAVEGAQVVFQVWSVPNLSRTEIVGSASRGAAAVAAQLSPGTYLVSAGAFSGRAADVSQPMASVLVVSGSNDLAAGAAKFVHGSTLWSVGFRLPGTGDSQPDLPSASFALNSISGSSAPRTVASQRIESAQIAATGVTITGACQIDGVHGYPFRLVIWRTLAGASFQLNAGKDICVSGDIPAGQFTLSPGIIAR